MSSRTKIDRKYLFVLSLVWICSPLFPAQAQLAQEKFGKNRIQFQQRKWEYLSSENFDLYYYGNRKTIANQAIEFIEKEFDRITYLIGYSPYVKTKIFLYNSTSHLQESNIGLWQTQHSIGGRTKFIKPYVEIAHPGTIDMLKTELVLKTSELLINQMMYGGNIKTMLKNAVLLNLPDWFISGMAHYVAKGWSKEMDDYVRQLVKHKSARRAFQLTGNNATIVGHSLWNYIAEKYGKSNLSNILNYTRIVRNERKSIIVSLGTSFRVLTNNWHDYYGGMGKTIDEQYVVPSDSNLIRMRHRPSVVYTTVKLSPDGTRLAYAENDRGRFVVRIRSLENGKERGVYRGGNRVFKQENDFSMPLISWADNNTLGIVGVKRSRVILSLYNLSNNTTLKRKLSRFSNVRSIDFSRSGRLAILSADENGQNDLFLIGRNNGRIRRITHDIFDDIDASFSPQSNTIIFSSNRTTDTINSINQRPINELPTTYNLYTLNLDKLQNVVNKITNILSKNYAPLIYSNNTIYFLSEQNGISNLFSYKTSTGIYRQVTNFNTSIASWDAHFGKRLITTVMRENLQERIFLIDNFDFEQQKFTSSTARRQVEQARELAIRRSKSTKEEEEHPNIKSLLNKRLEETQDSIPPLQSADIIFSKEKKSTTKDSIITTKDYSFTDEEQEHNVESFLNKYMKARAKSRVKGPFKYNPKFMSNNFVTNFDIHPIWGFNLRIETQMNDVLENYRFFGGTQTAFDWQSGHIYAEAQYLAHRLDYSVRFNRKSILWNNNTASHLYSWQKLEIGIAFPITIRLRLTFKPFIGYAESIDLGSGFPPSSPPVFQGKIIQGYVGYKSELVYDNSVIIGLNTIEGTKGKASIVQYAGLDGRPVDFSHVFIDIRHYQKIYKEIILVARGYLGTFFGSSPKKYVLGGVDNWWIGNATNREGSSNPLAFTETFNNDLIFTEFATNLRGFDYSTQYGNSVGLLNIELRIPIIRTLASGPITSNFFRNLNLVAFYDIGASWNGLPPINRNTSQSRLVPENPSGNPFRIAIKDFLNPWIYSYGIGLRAKILGFYTKLDTAWPVQNYSIGRPRFLLSLGFDF